MNYPTIKFKPGISRIIINLLWAVLFLIFSLAALGLGLQSLDAGEWLLGIGALIVCPFLVYIALVNYLVGSFTSYIKFDGQTFEFRNIKEKYVIPMNELVNVQWSSRRGKIQTFTFQTANGNLEFGAEIYSKGDNERLKNLIQDLFRPSSGILRQVSGQLSSQVQIQPTDQTGSAEFCGECGASAVGQNFCQKCGAKIEL